MFLKISLDIGQFLIKIWDAAAEQLKHFRMPEPHIRNLEKTRAKLMVKEEDINSSISEAQREGKIPTNEMQQWMREAEELTRKAAATEQDFERRRCLYSLSWNCFTVNRRVAKRLDEIDKLMKQLNDIPVVTKPSPPAIVQIPISNSMLGMEAYMKVVLDHIAHTNAGVIGIYGMGGVGKTTLLTNINNHRDLAVFEHVILEVASKECKMERLQKALAKRLKLQPQDDDNEEDRAIKLYDFLKNKDCLLLLDDLWVPLDLAKLGMAHAPGQREQKRKVVVFTSRREQVCGSMRAGKKIEIKCLAPEQAWELFRRNAGEDAIGSDAGINYTAHLIAEECAGLPLALVTVGMAMSTKKSWEAWKDALIQMKNSQMPKVTGMNEADPMFAAFKLSYDSLEDDDMKARLLSCALWPADESIYKDDLIECWMGLGLIDEVGAIHKAYNRGHSHIETLKAACLLESSNNDKIVKMHNVIRDMALWMISDCGKNSFKWIVRAGGAVNQALEEEGWHEAERASLMYNDIVSLPNQLSTCSKLSVLMLQGNFELQEIPRTLIQAMSTLTYLDLEHTYISEIPKEIRMLSQLQNLNLSWTAIKELPAELSCLAKLKYLFLRETFVLTTVADGAISNLSSLRLLDLRGSGYEDCWNELENLGHQISIGIDIITAADLQYLCSLAHVSAWRLNVISLSDSANQNQLFDDIMRSRNIRQHMEELSIRYAEMDEILISMENKRAGGFECLKYLELFRLGLLAEITWKEVQPQIVFPNLRELVIYRCNKLKNVNWAMQLPSLSVLIISFSEAIEELINDDGISSSSSFGLRKMILLNITKLKRISSKPLIFPYLEDMEVINCPLLVKLPFKNRISVNRLNVIRCDPAWWDKLKWEEISIKHSLSPLVQRNRILTPLVQRNRILTLESWYSR